MPLFMEYNIVQMSTAASYGGTDPSSPIFNDSAAQIRLNLSDGVGYVDFKGIGRLRLIGIDLRLQETPQEKVCTFALTNTHFDNKVLSFGRAAQSCNLPW